MRRMTMIVPVMLVAVLAFAGGSDRPTEAGEALDQFATPCKPCVWEYSHHIVLEGEPIEAIAGSGLLHGFWLGPTDTRLRIWNGEPDSDQIGRFTIGLMAPRRSIFYELNVRFDAGLYLDAATGSVEVTLLYR